MFSRVKPYLDETPTAALIESSLRIAALKDFLTLASFFFRVSGLAHERIWAGRASLDEVPARPDDVQLTFIAG